MKTVEGFGFIKKDGKGFDKKGRRILNSVWKEALRMEWGVTFLADLWRMREKIDRARDGLPEESPIAHEREIWQWVEKLPKFEGTGKRGLKPRSSKTIKF